MPDLTLALHRRNARIQAHQANGVPVEGGWRDPWYFGGDFLAVFGVRCCACGRTPTGSWTNGQSVLPTPESWERHVLRESCDHLLPLLAAEDPPAVLALTDLEILAGEGP